VATVVYATRRGHWAQVEDTADLVFAARADDWIQVKGGGASSASVAEAAALADSIAATYTGTAAVAESVALVDAVDGAQTGISAKVAGELRVTFTGGAVSSFTVSSHRVVSMRNGLLLIAAMNTGTKTVTGVTVAGNAATLVGAAAGNPGYRLAVYAYVAPAAGTPDIIVSYDSAASENVVIYTVNVSDVRQSGGSWRTVATSAPSSPTTGVSDAATSQSGDLVVDFVCGARQPAPGTGQDARGPCNYPPGVGMSSKAATGSSTTMEWTWASTSNPATHVAFALIGDETGSLPPLGGPSHPRGKKSWWLGTVTNPPENYDASDQVAYPGVSAASDNTSSGAWVAAHRHAGRITLHEVYVHSNTATADTTAKLRHESTVIDTITFGAGSTGRFANALNYQVATPEWHANEYVQRGGTGVVGIKGFGYVFEPDGSSAISYLGHMSDGQPLMNAASTYSAYPHGHKEFVLSGDTPLPLPLDLTLRYWWASLIDTAGFSVQMQSLKNGAAGVFATTWAPTEGGIRTDVASSQSYARGDTLSWRWTTGAGSGTEQIAAFSVYGENADGEFLLLTGDSDSISFALGGTYFLAPAGELNSVTTESTAQFRAPFRMTAMRLFVDMLDNNFTNEGPSTNSEVVLRVNGADSALRITIPRADTGPRQYIDLDRAVQIEEGDLICYSVRPGGSAGSPTVRLRGVGMVAVSDGGASATVSESAALSDTAAASTTWAAATAEAAALSDAQSAAFEYVGAMAETVTLSDAPAAATTWVAALTDAMTTADLVQAGSDIYNASLTETLNAADSALAAVLWNATSTEALALLDQVAASMGIDMPLAAPVFARVIGNIRARRVGRESL
jgi:hypothetical protein